MCILLCTSTRGETGTRSLSIGREAPQASKPSLQLFPAELELVGYLWGAPTAYSHVKEIPASVKQTLRREPLPLKAFLQQKRHSSHLWVFWKRLCPRTWSLEAWNLEARGASLPMESLRVPVSPRVRVCSRMHIFGIQGCTQCFSLLHLFLGAAVAKHSCLDRGRAHISACLRSTPCGDPGS